MMSLSSSVSRRVLVLGTLVLGLAACQTTGATSANSAGADPLAAYKAAVPALEQAGGGKACVDCFLTNYGPSPFPKAFAVSPDGAYGARYKVGASMAKMREDALASCRKKPAFNPAHDCFIFFENDEQVWKP
ncbi:MAG: hypothetical protein H3C38_13110 [Rhodospirillales bacterium]|nr:hypothetical protein [Rhodospirillales bacterium]